MSDLQLQEQQKVDEVRERLSSCPIVQRYGCEEAGALVHAFSDLEESCRIFLKEQIPKLVDPSTQGEQLEDLLMEIREEFRHILYHIHDPQFFRAMEPTHEWQCLHESAKR